MADIDLKDNAIGPQGMNFFKHMLKENKRLTELVSYECLFMNFLIFFRYYSIVV